MSHLMHYIYINILFYIILIPSIFSWTSCKLFFPVNLSFALQLIFSWSTHIFISYIYFYILSIWQNIIWVAKKSRCQHVRIYVNFEVFYWVDVPVITLLKKETNKFKKKKIKLSNPLIYHGLSRDLPWWINGHNLRHIFNFKNFKNLYN